MKQTYKVAYHVTNPYKRKQFFLTDSDKILSDKIVFDTREKGYFKAKEEAERAGFKI